jgi:hypothetical protein
MSHIAVMLLHSEGSVPLRRFPLQLLQASGHTSRA